jgi:molybdopterin-synthase adenylyltransferase
MIELVLQSPHLEHVLPELLNQDRESCVILLTNPVSRSSGDLRLLAADFIVPTPEAYSQRGLAKAELSPDFVALVAKRAAREGFGLVFVHSHPGARPPHFSETDDEGEKHLAAFLNRRLPEVTHAALVVSKGGQAGRVLGTNDPIRVVEVGMKRRLLFDGKREPDGTVESRHDRQVRAFGVEGQNQLSDLSIGIVGLGGTGSIVAQELAHLGVRRFVLIDPDTVESTNLNRLANAVPSDVGRPKTEMAARYITAVAPEADVKMVIGDVIRSSVARPLGDLDVIFGCTDSHGSRAVLQQIAYQYLVPCIDMGSTIVASGTQITHVQGRVQMLAPGLPCLTCSMLLDPNEVRRDMMTAFERQSDPYIVGAREPAPAVMSINATIASLGVTMLLAAITGLPSDARHLLYNALTSSLRVIAPTADPECFICSMSGALARGDHAGLMARQD